MPIFRRTPHDTDLSALPSGLTSLAVVLGLAALVILYLVVGQFLGSVNVEMLPDEELAVGKSHIVDANARMLQRELDTGWGPSARLSPLWVRTDVSSFQQGLLDVITKSTQELNNIFRVGSEAVAGDDLKTAANDVNRPANEWSIFSSNSTVDRLHDAVKRLDRVNAQQSAASLPTLGGRIDLVAAQLNDYIILLSDEHTRLDKVASDGNAIFGVRAPFYHAQGILTGVCLELKAARQDFRQVLEMQSALGIFDQATDKTCETLNIRPLPVVNGSGYSLWGGNVKNLSGQIGTVLYNLSAVQSSLASAPAQHSLTLKP